MGTDGTHWAALVPELTVADPARSRAFYVDLLGFSVRFERPEDGFLYLEMGEAQIMLDLWREPDAMWMTAPLEPPLGRGINFQIEVDDVGAIHDRVTAAEVPLFRPLKESWYREGDHENGQIEFLVQDPDGYLLRFMQHLGTRPAKGT